MKISSREHLSTVAGLVVRHGDLSHEMTLSHEGRRPECMNSGYDTLKFVTLPCDHDKLITLA